MKWPMNTICPVPIIPIDGVMSYEDWLKGRRFRRQLSELVAPGDNRRESSSSDQRLRALFNGERGLPFTPTDKLQTELPKPGEPASP